jgi:hypothetical protein
VHLVRRLVVVNDKSGARGRRDESDSLAIDRRVQSGREQAMIRYLYGARYIDRKGGLT